MDNAATKTGLARKMIREMNGIVVPRQRGKADHIIGHDGLHQTLAHSKTEVFEKIFLNSQLAHFVFVFEWIRPKLIDY